MKYFRRHAIWGLLAFLCLSVGFASAQTPPDGQAVYTANCTVCHGAEGQGGVGVPLANDANLKDPDFHIRQILNGGNTMPPFAAALSDAEIAAVATFERTSWQNDFGAVTADQVAAVRAGGSANAPAAAAAAPAGQTHAGENSPGQSAAAPAPAAASATPAAAAVTVAVASAPGAERLVDGNGMTLYVFLNDSLTGTSHCVAPCTTHWTPLIVAGTAAAGNGVTASDLGTVARADGSQQVTFRGWPLYLSTADKAAGDTIGADLSGMWQVADPGFANISASMTAAPTTRAGATPTPIPPFTPPAVTPTVYQGTYDSVTDARLTQPEPENWLMYKRTYDLQAFSPLDQITVDNVTDLVPVWSFGTGMSDGHEAPPIVNGGMMFATGPFSTLFALDARTGDLIWKYARELPADVAPEVCCGMVNRGVALYGDKVYLATLDAHLLAFTATTGELVWDVPVEDYLLGYAMTLAPLAVHGKILVGAAGGEYGVRGFVAAFDSETGALDWKTHMIPAPGEPGSETWPGDTWKTGGGAIWVTGSYDPETNITYWGTSNAAPWMGDLRPGDNLYTASVVALDADTGEIKSHYQYVPNDSWDYDEISDQTLVDIERDGKQLKGLIHAARSGNFYLLDRTNLGFVYGEPYIATADRTITGFDADGRPIIPDDRKPGVGKTVNTCPATGGGNNWFGLAYSPDTGYAYIPTMEFCMTIQGTDAEYRAGQTFTGAINKKYIPTDVVGAGALQAIDVATGEVVWRHDQQMPVRSPVMATAGGLVFGGDIYDRELRAYDAKTGEIVWRFKTNSSVVGVPVSFELDGVQYIAVEAGYGGVAASYIAQAAVIYGVPFNPVSGGAVWVFALKSSSSAAAGQ